MIKRSFLKLVDFLENSIISERKIYNSLKVVLYHSVSDEDNFLISNLGNTINIDKLNFENHLKFYKNNFNVISFRDIISGKEIKKNSLIITFDDGFKDNFTYAYPLLKKYNLPATICVTSSFLDNNNMFWLSKIQLLKTRNLYNLFQKKYPVIDIKKNNHLEVDSFINSIFKENNVNLSKLCNTHQLYLNSDDILSMDSKLITICSHSHSHFKTNNLNEKDREFEIKESIRILSKFSKHYLPVYSFPFGISGVTYDKQDLTLLSKYNIYYFFSSLNGGGVNYRVKRNILRSSISSQVFDLDSLNNFIKRSYHYKRFLKNLYNYFS